MKITEQAVKAMPERIYASIPSTRGCVVSFDAPSLAYDIEYIRADVAAPTAAAPYMSGVSAREQALEDALKNLLHAVCGETGFANAVRQVSGLPWPWPSLDIAEAKAIRALSAEPAAPAVPDVPELVRYSSIKRYGSEEVIERNENGEYVRHDQAAEMIAAKDAEIESSREALEFYADKTKWDNGGFEHGLSEDGGHNVLTLHMSDVHNDCGQIARSALSGTEPS